MLKKIEISFVALSIIGFILKLLKIPGGTTIMLLSLLILSIIYFAFAFALFNDFSFKNSSQFKITTLRLIGSIGLGVGLSTLLIGILFKLQHYPGAHLMMMIGAVATGLAAIVALIKYLLNKSKFYPSILIRTITYIPIAILLMTLPKYWDLKIIYRNHPAYRDALIKYMDDDSRDEKLEIKMNEEHQKMELEEAGNRK